MTNSSICDAKGVREETGGRVSRIRKSVPFVRPIRNGNLTSTLVILALRLTGYASAHQNHAPHHFDASDARMLMRHRRAPPRTIPYILVCRAKSVCVLISRNFGPNGKLAIEVRTRRKK